MPVGIFFITLITVFKVFYKSMIVAEIFMSSSTMKL